MAVARSSSGGVTIRYILPVLWMTSRLAVVGRIWRCVASGVAIPEQSLMSMSALLLVRSAVPSFSNQLVTMLFCLSVMCWYSADE